jgi:glycosyltransferase involved in cell wall biosynthesis
MQRGVETGIFAPQQRTREACDGRIVFGYVGRLSVEKNVALLPRVDKELRARGIVAEWMIVGHGAEDEMLRRGLPGAKLVGVLRGEALSEAYANMDVLVFPSHTDTFGNVVLEALASGVPAVVTPDGGPASIVQDGVTGRVAKDEEFSAEIAEMLALPESFRAMRVAARRYAMQCSWDAVFERVVAAYPMTS